jgi:Ca2+-binding EF-hand superfamily protein
MKKTILGAAALAGLAAFPAAAQPPAAPMPPREARTVTRADFEQRLHAHFAKLDINRDNYVDRGEAEARMGRLRGAAGPGADGPRPRHARMDPNAMFDRLDANRDGAITKAEFLAFHAGRHHKPAGAGDEMHGPMARGDALRGPAGGPDGTMRAMRPRRAGMHMGFGGRWFDRLDADHDGRVSLAEADRGATAMFDRLDANRDGTISPDERMAARDRMRQHMGERRDQ